MVLMVVVCLWLRWVIAIAVAMTLVVVVVVSIQIPLVTDPMVSLSLCCAAC
jgi:F0F1-type ATP synthase assembly protein I